MTESTESRQVILFCFCGPSGSGKTSICERIVDLEPALRLSISTTTRAKRPSEEEGLHYRFVTKEVFEKQIAEGKFLEHAEYSGNYYGTELRNIEEATQSGVDLVFDIDVQGVVQLRKSFGEQAVVVFVSPPSEAALRERIALRGENTEEDTTRRLERARDEVKQLSSPELSDYMLINDDLGRAIQDAQAIIRAERMRIERGALANVAK